MKGVYKRSPETIEKLRQWTKENPHPFPKGHTINTGIKWTQERREKMSKIFKGRIFTDEWKKKISEARKKVIGVRSSNYKHGKYAVIGAIKRSAPPKPEFCEVCNMPERELKQGLYVDHNHRTNEFRGWLCHRCNVALGFVNDNPDILQALINYLKKDATR